MGVCHSTLQAAIQRGAVGERRASAAMPVRKPYISQASLLMYTHTSAGFMAGFKRLFLETDIKRGLGSEYRSQPKKKKTAPPPPPLLIPHFVSLSSPIIHSATLLPRPLQCCAVPAGFQGAANGLWLIYMQPGWDTCRHSSPSNGAVQGSQLNTTERTDGHPPS